MPLAHTSDNTPSTNPLLASFGAAYTDMVRFLTRRTGNVDDARDLVHDIWLRLADKGTLAHHEALADSPRAYLFAIAHNIAMDHLRRGKLLRDYVQDGWQRTLDGQPHSPDVADSLMYHQALDAVEDALNSLPARARDVFLAHRLHGEGQAALANRLDVSLNTIERDVMLATQRIEAALHAWRGPQNAPAATPASPATPRAIRRRSLGALLGLFTVGSTGILLWHQLRQDSLQWQAALQTQRGRGLQQPLPDGSSIALDADSRLEAAYYRNRRQVQLLQGAAFFAVARDPDRPFIVHALGTQVTVLGTRFGVEIEGRAVRVQVESGRVQVQTGKLGAAPLELGAGQGLLITPDGSPQTSNGMAAPWRTGELHFDATPLDMAVARLARYAPVAFDVDADVAQLPVSGTIQIAHARDWLAALPKALPVQVQSRHDGSLRISARKL